MPARGSGETGERGGIDIELNYITFLYVLSYYFYEGEEDKVE